MNRTGQCCCGDRLVDKSRLANFGADRCTLRTSGNRFFDVLVESSSPRLISLKYPAMADRWGTSGTARHKRGYAPQLPPVPTRDNLSSRGHPAEDSLLLDRDHAEQAVGVVIWSCSKEEFVGGAVCTGTLAEVQSPKLINRYRRAGCVGQCAEESAAAGVEGVDPAVLDVVGDQDRVAELAEIVGSQCQAPRGMEWAVDGVVFENGPVRVENIHKTVLPFVQRGKGHPQFAVDLPHAVWGEILRDSRVAKRHYKVEVTIEHIDFPVRTIVGGVNEIGVIGVWVAGDRQGSIAGVDPRPVDRHNGVGGIDLGFQPLMVPSCVAKMKIGLAVFFFTVTSN